jgi:hypothetical protein
VEAERGRGDLEGDYLDIAVRAWAVREQPAGDEDQAEQTGAPPDGPRRPERVPDQFLVFDTETTTDSSQRLLFGCWRYLRANHEEGLRLETVEEGIFYPDDYRSSTATSSRCIPPSAR